MEEIMAVSFNDKIKPYFSQVDRDSMNDANHTGGFTLDLWSRDDCQTYFDTIKNAIDSKMMPPPNGWADARIKAFDADFGAWQAGGYQP
jgi:hypothetical protein